MKEIVDFLKNHFLVRDSLFVIVLFYVFNAVLSGLTCSDFINLVLQNAIQLFPILLTSGITLLGFLITGLSVLMGFLGQEKLERLKDAGYFTDIFGIYFNAIIFCGIFTVLALWGLLVPCLPACHSVSLIMFLLAARIWRCVWIIRSLSLLIYK